jgi:hypothetical protein
MWNDMDFSCNSDIASTNNNGFWKSKGSQIDTKDPLMSIIHHVRHQSYFVQSHPRKHHDSFDSSDTSRSSLLSESPVSEMGFENTLSTSILTYRMKTLNTEDLFVSPTMENNSHSGYFGSHSRSQSMDQPTITPTSLKIRTTLNRDQFKIIRHRTHNRSKSLDIASHTLQKQALQTNNSPIKTSMDLRESRDDMNFEFGAYGECGPITEENDLDDLFVPIMTKELEALFETCADYRDLKCDQFNRSKMSTIKNTSDKLDYLMLLEKYIPRNRGILSDSAKSFVNLCLPIIHCFRMHHNSDKNEFMETFDKGISHTRFKFNHCNILRRGYDHSHGCKAKKRRLEIIGVCT